MRLTDLLRPTRIISSNERLLNIFMNVSAVYCILYSIIFMWLGAYTSAFFQFSVSVIIGLSKITIGTKWSSTGKLITIVTTYLITILQVFVFFGGRAGFQYMLIGHMIVVLLLYELDCNRDKGIYLGYAIVTIWIVVFGDRISPSNFEFGFTQGAMTFFFFSSRFGVLAGTIYIMYEYSKENRFLEQKLSKWMSHDIVTGLFSRMYFMKEMASYFGEEDTFVTALIDIDYFKSINDTYGYEKGDAVLTKVARLIGEDFSDQVASRYNGETFALLFKDDSLDCVIERLEQFRSRLQSNAVEIDDNRSVYLTVSIGVVEKQISYSNYNAILSRTEEALYLAKARGRDRICKL